MPLYKKNAFLVLNLDPTVTVKTCSYVKSTTLSLSVAPTQTAIIASF